MRRVGHTRFQGHRSVCIFIFVTVLLSNAGPALAADSSGTPTERLEPAIASGTSLRQIPVSNLNLALTGLVRREVGIALISVKGARAKPFSVGDAIVPDVKLLAVGTSSAIISRDGMLERLELNRRGGEPDTGGGFRVTGMVPGSFYDTLGLQDGDTVSAINGKPPHISDLLSFYRQRDSMKTVQIQVVRDGSPRNFQLDFH